MSASTPVRLVPSPSPLPSPAPWPRGDDRPTLAHLPVPPTPLFGRERETELLRELVANGNRRLVTLTGPGGVGKTRLALRVAAGLTDQFAAGVAFVSFAQITDAAFLLRAIALTLGVGADASSQPDRAWHNGLVSALRERQILLLLDNLEHLVDGAPALTDLLSACPSVRILATSRIPLRLSDEQEFPVSSLSVPVDSAAPRLLDASPAVALFVERARAVQPTFGLNEVNAAAVAEICRRLDGLPLAIELAASRIAHLPPTALLARLERRLPLLTGGPRDAPPRHRTMRDTIAWSVGLLDDQTRAVFVRLGIFTGSCTLDAAEAVAGDQLTERPNAAFDPAVFDAIGVLVDSSLLHLMPDPDPGHASEPRYAMLETIREYARELLDLSGETERVAARLAEWLAGLNDRAAAEIRGPSQAAWLDRLDADWANFRAMTAWALDQADPQTALRLTTKAAWFYWETRGLMREESRLLVRALEIAEANPNRVDAALLGRGLMAHGMRLATTGNLAEADVRMAAAIAALTRAGDRNAVAAAQSNYAGILAERGQYAQARAMYEAAAEYRRILGDARRIILLVNIGAMMTSEGDLAGAKLRLDDARPLVEDLGEPRDRAFLSYFQGEAALYSGQIAEARELLTAAYARLSEIPDLTGMAMTACQIALMHTLAGELPPAAERVRDAIERAREIGARPIATAALDVLAGVLIDTGQPDAAARMLGAAAAMRAAMGAPLRPVDRPHWEGMVRQARAALGPEAFAAAEERGRATQPDVVLSEAIALATSVVTTALDGKVTPGRLGTITAIDDLSSLFTEREEAVLGLLVQGLSDREIGAQLFISSRTASSHVGRILAKLDVSTRTAATAVALRDGHVRLDAASA